jgi:UDP-glucose 6-dehydrogenase
LDFERGGAGWNSMRVRSFIQRVHDIVEISQAIVAGGDNAVAMLSKYLVALFNLHLGEAMKKRFNSFLKLRVTNKMDRIALQKGLDAPQLMGGMGLHKSTAEKISREVEIIMLMKYSQ